VEKEAEEEEGEEEGHCRPGSGMGVEDPSV